MDPRIAAPDTASAEAVRLPRWEQAALVAAALLGFLLSGWGLGGFGLNKDESLTWWIVQAGRLDRVWDRSCRFWPRMRRTGA